MMDTASHTVEQGPPLAASPCSSLLIPLGTRYMTPHVATCPLPYWFLSSIEVFQFLCMRSASDSHKLLTLDRRHPMNTSSKTVIVLCRIL